MIDLPANPVDGQEVTFDDRTWVWRAGVGGGAIGAWDMKPVSSGDANLAAAAASTATAAKNDAVAARDKAQQWSTKTDGEVEPGQGRGAKYYAELAAASEQGALDASGLFVDLAAFGVAATDGQMGGIKAADPNNAYDIAQKVAGVSTLTGQSVPSSKGTARALSLTDRLSSNSFKLFKRYAGLLELKFDVNGALRVYENSKDGSAPVYYGLSANGLTKEQISIESTKNIPTLKNFPSSIHLFIDTNGEYRVARRIDANRPGQAVVFGAQSMPLPTEFYVLLGAGQSNLDGRGNALQSPDVPAGVAYQFVDGVLSPLADPVGTAATGSLWPAFALSFWKRTGFGLIVVPTAVGGSSVVAAAQPGSNWDTTGTLRASSIAKLNAAFNYLTANNFAWQFGGNVWWEGEQAAYSIDHAVAGVTKAIYKTAFQNMVAANVADIGNHPMLVIRVGRETVADTSGYQQIRAAQDELCKSLADVRMSFTGVVNFPTRGLMNGDGTGVHVGQTGLNEVGDKLGIVAGVLCLGRN